MKIMDMHCDTISILLEKRRKGQPEALLKNTCHVDLRRMKKSGYLLQNFALFVNLSVCDNPWEEVCALYSLYEEELGRNQDMVAPVLQYADIAKNEAAGKLSAMLTVEEGGVCQGDTEKLRKLYEMGVRMLTLTWNHPNELGYPNLDHARGKEVWKMCRELQEKKSVFLSMSKEAAQEKREAQAIFEEYFHTPNLTGGLTKKGREFVAEMESLGMIIDVSHLSDAGFYDVLAETKKPFVASHSNAREVCRCVRNLSDDMIRRLSERGGCMGLNFCADFLREVPVGTKNPGTVDDVVRHARHIARMGGMEVLGIGSDFDGIDTHEELPGAQSMELLWEALHKAGFTQSQLDKIFYGNVLRVYGEVLK